MWIRRVAEPVLQKAARTRPVVVLTGARQTGKTSLLRRVFPDYGFVSLDLPTEAAQAEQEPDAFLARHPPPVIIDEAQYAPLLFRHLKARIDADRQRNGQYLLTGSQRFTLMNGIAESLAGRVAVFDLEGLSLAEIRAAIPELEVMSAIIRGGFPELFANLDIDGTTFYNSYLATYLERDVRTLANVGSLRDFERFLRACALRSGNLLNKAELARDVGIAPSTSNQWLSVLEASGQIHLLEPWFSNRTKSIVKAPKLYLADTGILCALLNIQTVQELAETPLAGAIWETFVFAQLRHRERKLRRRGNLFFWRDQTREVDFVVEAGHRIELFEARWTELPTPADTTHLAALRDRVGAKRVAMAAAVTRAAHAFPLGDGRVAIGVSDLA
jgi:uncharacterized protein